MENKLTTELIEKARSAKTPEELMNLAAENGFALTEEEAKAYFSKLHPSESRKLRLIVSGFMLTVKIFPILPSAAAKIGSIPSEIISA